MSIRKTPEYTEFKYASQFFKLKLNKTSIQKTSTHLVNIVHLDLHIILCDWNIVSPVKEHKTLNVSNVCV